MVVDLKKRFNKLLQANPFHIIDVGAGGGCKEKWKGLKPYLKLVGFEPDEIEFVRLSQGAEASSSQIYFNTALYNSASEQVFHLSKNARFSSIRKINPAFRDSFHKSNTCHYEPEGTRLIRVNRLEDSVQPGLLSQTDFLKVDVEGCAFEVLEGSQRLLEGQLVAGVAVETEFNQKFADQKLFSDVDRYLRRFGYQLFDMKTCRWKRKSGLKTGGSEGQLIHGDFIYFIDPDIFYRRLKELGPDERAAKTVKYVVLACLYGQCDLALDLVERGHRAGFVDHGQARFLFESLRKCQGLLFRMKKLKNRGPVHQLAYHIFMAIAGVWMEKQGYFRPTVRI